MNPEDHRETSNAAKVGTGHGGFGDLFGVLVSAEVASSGEVGHHDLAAPPIILDATAVLENPALLDSLILDANLAAPYVPDAHPALVALPVATLFLCMFQLPPCSSAWCSCSPARSHCSSCSSTSSG